ncbi:hypothetical protein J0656_18515 [Muricauda ruestringensis]|uniref:Uncharacterized protein n=1 Tax=Flagellimonas aurea TaxID=2915619 RepID=A0ABS3GAU4_9FLAO|nr:hypothetical protein [Allomuricauda aurea]MBO0356018.1 hypothetical protein [Allomuricauda aurea]
MQQEQILEQLNSLDTKIWAAIIAALVSVLVAYLNYRNQKRALRLQQQQIDILQNDKKIEKLRNRLDGFYYPFDLLLSKSTELYKIFRNGLPREFRTLVYLIDKNTKFEDSDGEFKQVELSDEKMNILNHIIDSLSGLEDLINSKSSLVDDKRLTMAYEPNSKITDIKLPVDSERPTSMPNDIGLFTLFIVHVHYLKSAFKGEVAVSDLELVKNYVYPRELNGIIKENIASLKAKINEISV